MERIVVKIILFLSLIMPASYLEAGHITIIKQRPLISSINTRDIEKSKGHSQFALQKDAYNRIARMVEGKRTKLIISAHCQGKMDRYYSKNHNGWNYSTLRDLRDHPLYEDILAPTPLKLKARYEDLKVVCGQKSGGLEDLATANLDRNPVIVVRDNQVDGLIQKFRSKGIPARVITPKRDRAI